jgi:hypothetical protein
MVALYEIFSSFPEELFRERLHFGELCLHYVYDLWTHRWRRKATGDVDRHPLCG